MGGVLAGRQGAARGPGPGAPALLEASQGKWDRPHARRLWEGVAAHSASQVVGARGGAQVCSDAPRGAVLYLAKDLQLRTEQDGQGRGRVLRGKSTPGTARMGRPLRDRAVSGAGEASSPPALARATWSHCKGKSGSSGELGEGCRRGGWRWDRAQDTRAQDTKKALKGQALRNTRNPFCPQASPTACSALARALLSTPAPPLCRAR